MSEKEKLVVLMQLHKIGLVSYEELASRCGIPIESLLMKRLLAMGIPSKRAYEIMEEMEKSK